LQRILQIEEHVREQYLLEVEIQQVKMPDIQRKTQNYNNSVWGE
jgi:hypothetical protein